MKHRKKNRILCDPAWLINASETREDDETFKNAVDMLFEELEKEEPEHFAVRQYKKYKLAAGKTAKSILISCGARLAPFDIAELREIMSYDEMELDMVGDQRTALFIIISDTDDTFNFMYDDVQPVIQPVMTERTMYIMEDCHIMSESSVTSSQISVRFQSLTS